MLRKFSLLAIFFILIFSILNIMSNTEICKAKNADTLNVGGTGIGNYTTIQDAINNSNDNDTIYVYSGTYNENLIINKSITLIGSDKDTTFIKGNNSLYIILIKSSWINITRFSIQNGRVGIYVNGQNYSFNNFSDNIIKNNWEGIRLYYSSNNKILGNVIINNSNFGIVLHESKNNIITKNNLLNNSNAISLNRWSDKNLIYRNNLSENFFGISLKSSFFNLIYENYIINNSKGIYLSYSKNNSITNNSVELNKESGIYLIDSYNNSISLNNFSNNNQDIKRGPEPPKIKAPGFDFFFIICSMLFVLFFKRNPFNLFK